jgi:hypothetical protein
MGTLAGLVEKDGSGVSGAKLIIIDKDTDLVTGTATTGVDGTWSKTVPSVDEAHPGYEVYARYSESGVLYTGLIEAGVKPVIDPFGDLVAFGTHQLSLIAAKVALRRAMAATATGDFDVETEHSPNGYRIDQPTGGSRPVIRTTTGAVGGTWIIDSTTNRWLRVRNAANSADIVGSTLMPTAGCLYAVFKGSDGGENLLSSVLMGCQVNSGSFPSLLIGIENEIRGAAGNAGVGHYLVPLGSEPSSLTGVIFKWNATTMRARVFGGSWVSQSTTASGQAAAIASALAAQFLFFAGCSGQANDMQLCLAGVTSNYPSDAEVDDAGGLEDLMQTAWDASVST